MEKKEEHKCKCGGRCGGNCSCGKHKVADTPNNKEASNSTESKCGCGGHCGCGEHK